MADSLINFDQDPKPSMKWGFFGREKRGKTHGMVSACVAACRELNLPGNIGVIATENWLPDWLKRDEGKPGLKEVTGKKIALCQTGDPAVALRFAKECEASSEISILMIDCGSDLVKHDRDKFMTNKMRAPKGAEYSIVDRPFNNFVAWAAGTSLHFLCTLREEDDKQEVEDQEIVIGKSGKTKLAEVARPLIHCTLRHGKGGNSTYHSFVKNTAGSSVTLLNPTSVDWAKLMERYK